MPMASIEFPAHGQYALSLDGPVICLRARGPWNREAVVQYRDERAKLIERLGGQPWGLLATVQGEALLLPDAAELLGQYTASDVACGRVATAVVLDGVVLADLVCDKFRAMYRGQPQAVRFFNDREQARAWLDGQLALARSDTLAVIA